MPDDPDDGTPNGAVIRDAAADVRLAQGEARHAAGVARKVQEFANAAESRRDSVADGREDIADDREAVADAREVDADVRDMQVDAKVADADARIAQADASIAEAQQRLDTARQQTDASIERAQTGLNAAREHMREARSHMRTVAAREDDMVASKLAADEQLERAAAAIVNATDDSEAYERAVYHYTQLVRHRMANPLQTISGMAQTLLDLPGLEPEQRLEMVEAIRQQADVLAVICLEPRVIDTVESELRPRPFE